MIPCIIPARGGSRGIPRKNLQIVCGRPLLAWSIRQALASEEITHTIVATDDTEIADVAEQYGATVFHRSRESATDTAPSEAVLREVVEGRFGSADCVVFLQATSPCRQANDIDNAVRTLLDSAADSVFSARQIVGYTWKRRDSHAVPCYTSRGPRQAESYVSLEENGSIYVFRPHVLLEHHSRHGLHPLPYMMHPLDSFQIDEPEDVAFMEQMMALRLPSEVLT